MKQTKILVPILTLFLMLLPVNGAAANEDAVDSADADQVEACEVTDVTLKWGTLERWRSYITGSIAHGDWQLDGVQYELPEFVWSDGNGFIAKNGGSAEISFLGTVIFTGHDELLQVTVGNPVFNVDGDEGFLYLDLTSTTPTGEADVAVTGELAVIFDLRDALEITADSFQIVSAPGELTDEGAAAFGGFYDGGESVDGVTLTATTSAECEFDASELGLPVAGWLVIGVAVVAVGAITGVLVVRKGRRNG